MTSPRITQRLMVERSMTALQTGMGRLGRAQEQLSTGRLINRPSDSPTGANAAMRLREELAAGNQYARNASDGLSWLGRADSTLTSMLDGVRRSRDLMLQGASTGSTGTDARRALAAEVTQIRESLLSLANTEHLGRPLFGGTTGGGGVRRRRRLRGRHRGGQPHGRGRGRRPGQHQRARGVRCGRRQPVRGPRRGGRRARDEPGRPRRRAGPARRRLGADAHRARRRGHPIWSGRVGPDHGRLDHHRHPSGAFRGGERGHRQGDRRPAAAGGRLPGGARRDGPRDPAVPAGLLR